MDHLPKNKVIRGKLWQAFSEAYCLFISHPIVVGVCFLLFYSVIVLAGLIEKVCSNMQAFHLVSSVFILGVLAFCKFVSFLLIYFLVRAIHNRLTNCRVSLSGNIKDLLDNHFGYLMVLSLISSLHIFTAPLSLLWLLLLGMTTCLGAYAFPLVMSQTTQSFRNIASRALRLFLGTFFPFLVLLWIELLTIGVGAYLIRFIWVSKNFFLLLILLPVTVGLFLFALLGLPLVGSSLSAVVYHRKIEQKN